MGKRVLVAIPFVVVVLLAIFLQGWALAVFAVALSCICQFEIVRAMDKNGRPVVKWVSFAFAAALAVLFFQCYFYQGRGENPPLSLSSRAMAALFAVLFMAAFITAVLSKKHDAKSVINTVFTFVYPQTFFLLLYLLILDVMGLRDNMAATVLLLVFLPAMFSDTFAYFFGRALGKRKLAPEISPKKTVAGAVAGVAGGAIAGALILAVFKGMAYIGGRSGETAGFAVYMVFGAALAVVSQFGDLSASMLKRALGVKDFGKLMPGHGGIVDRLDSILFCIPAVYLIVSAMDAMVSGGW